MRLWCLARCLSRCLAKLSLQLITDCLVPYVVLDVVISLSMPTSFRNANCLNTMEIMLKCFEYQKPLDR